MSTIKCSPTTAQMVNNAPNTIVVGTLGQGRKFYLDENDNTIEDNVKDMVEEDE